MTSETKSLKGSNRALVSLGERGLNRSTAERQAVQGLWLPGISAW